MNRWSVSRTFRHVTANDFRQAVKGVQENMAEACKTPIDVSIKFYNGMKHSITSFQPGVNEWLDEMNAALVFDEVASVDDITDESWLKATFVEAVLRPADKEQAPSYTFGHIEAKGTRGKQMCFYVQPEAVGTPVKRASLGLFRNWRKGDGFASNHIVTFG